MRRSVMGYINNLDSKWNEVISNLELYPKITEKTELRLELSNICNHACLFCPNRKMSRKRRQMDGGLVERLLREGRELGIEKTGLFMNGEPFMTQELPEYIALAKKLGYKYVYITTNGALASKECMESVIKAGIDSIKFSINAGSRETYKIVHQKDDYDKVIRNLKYTYEYREKHSYHFKILSSCVVTRYMQNEIENHYKKIKPYVDELVFFQAESFAGQMEDEVQNLRVELKDKKRFPQYRLKHYAPCNALWNSINVTCEGYMTLCCSEAYNLNAIIDVNEMGIKEAWYSDKMVAMRERHVKKNLRGTLCGKCLGYSEGSVLPLNEELYIKSTSVFA